MEEGISSIFHKSALHYACRFGQTNCAKILCVSGARLDILNQNGWSILHDASRFGHLETIQFLISNYTEDIVNLAKIQNKLGSTPLHLACRGGHLEIVKLLYPISDLQILTIKKHHALHVALAARKTNVAMYILECGGGCDPLARDRNLADCLHYIGMNDLGSSRFNIDMKTICSIILGKLGRSDLQRVVFRNFDKYNNTPLHYATFHCLKSIIELLLDFYHDWEFVEGSNPLFDRNNDGFTAWDFSGPDIKEFIKVYYSKRKLTLLLQ